MLVKPDKPDNPPETPQTYSLGASTPYVTVRGETDFWDLPGLPADLPLNVRNGQFDLFPHKHGEVGANVISVAIYLN